MIVQSSLAYVNQFVVMESELKVNNAMMEILQVMTVALLTV